MTTTILLSQIPLFQGLSPGVLAPLQAACRVINVERDQVLFRQGDHGHEMYIIESGSVRIWIETPDGRELHLADFGEYQVLGELEIIDGKPRSASAKALEETRLVALPREVFFEQIGSYPGMAVHLMTVLCERLRANNERQLAARGVVAPEVRLAELLNLLAKSGQVTDFNRDQVSHILGLETADVDRILDSWEKRGFIKMVNPATIAIQDLKSVLAAAAV